MQTYQHYINGQFVDPKASVWFESENPYNGEVWASIPRGDADDVDLAVAAAKAQHDPHLPWFFTGVVTPFCLQSTDLGRLETRSSLVAWFESENECFVG